MQWQTEEPATSTVVFQREGVGASKTATRLSYKHSHRVKVRGLSEGTYRVTVRSTDLAGNTATRQGPTVEAGSACGCSSRSGPSTWDLLPFVGLFLVFGVVRRRLSVGRDNS